MIVICRIELQNVTKWHTEFAELNCGPSDYVATSAAAVAAAADDDDTIQYNTIQYKTCNAPYVTRMLFVGAGMTRD